MCIVRVHCFVSHAVWFFCVYAFFQYVPQKKAMHTFVLCLCMCVCVYLYCLCVLYVYTVSFLMQSGFFAYKLCFFSVRATKKSNAHINFVLCLCIIRCLRGAFFSITFFLVL